MRIKLQNKQMRNFYIKKRLPFEGFCIYICSTQKPRKYAVNHVLTQNMAFFLLKLRVNTHNIFSENT